MQVPVSCACAQSQSESKDDSSSFDIYKIQIPAECDEEVFSCLPQQTTSINRDFKGANRLSRIMLILQNFGFFSLSLTLLEVLQINTKW